MHAVLMHLCDLRAFARGISSAFKLRVKPEAFESAMEVLELLGALAKASAPANRMFVRLPTQTLHEK